MRRDQSRRVPSELHDARLDTVMRALRNSGAQSVLDLGCGSGELLLRLAQDSQFHKTVGVDISLDALRAAEALLAGLHKPEHRASVTLSHASFMSADPELAGYDAAAFVETIEHIDPGRLSEVERAVFGCYRPGTIIMTTPNREYNAVLGMPESAFRHPDHRFEWPRVRFRSWCRGVARRNGYEVRFGEIGEVHPLLGSATQMATFMRLACNQPTPATAGAGFA